MEAEEIGLVLGLIVVVFLGLAAALVIFHINYRAAMLKMENEKQIIAFKAAVEAEEKQKEKIARNLHDEVITLFTASGHRIEAYLGTFTDQNNIPKSLVEAKELIDQGIDGVRSIALDLIPNTFLNFGLIKALELYISQLGNAESDAELANHTNFGAGLPFSKNDQLTIYRICLELLTNLSKHASYTYLRVTIEQANKSLVVSFEHDGLGVSNQDIKKLGESSKGLGLKSLESRLMLLNASINYVIGIDTAKISLNIPLP